MKNVEYIKKLYLTMLRNHRKNQWLQIPKKDEPLFEELAKILEASQMEAYDYFQYHFKQMKGYPTVTRICRSGAIRQYDFHRKLKNIYLDEDYAIEGEDFYVNRTYKKYPLSQLKTGTSQDPDANFAITMAEGNFVFSKELWEAGEYALCKFKFKNKTPPATLTTMVERLRKELKR